MASRHPPASETELDVLKVLWEHGPATGRQVNTRLRRQGRRYAYTTVLTLLQRLEAKGHVRSDKSGLAYVFQAVLSREALMRGAERPGPRPVRWTRVPLVLALVEERLTPEEIAALCRKLDELEGTSGV